MSFLQMGPIRQPVLVAPRREGHEYQVDHQEGRFVIRSNDKHKNFRLVTAPEEDLSQSAWESLLEGSDELYIRDFSVFADFIAVVERVNGLNRIPPDGRRRAQHSR